MVTVKDRNGFREATAEEEAEIQAARPTLKSTDERLKALEAKVFGGA